MNDRETLRELYDPEGSGVLRLPKFVGEISLKSAHAELQDPERVAWRDNHSTFVNQRGLTIIQNHDVYALRLTAGDQSGLKRLHHIAAIARSVQYFVRDHLAPRFPALASWQPDELSLHRYDDAKVGLSYHKDNLRFIGVVAIASLDGECDLAIRSSAGETIYPAEPGDLFLLRAPGLADSSTDMRPEHAVINLRTPTRTSLMLRQNNRADERLPGFEFDNWQ